MAGLLLNSTLINQDWGNAALNLARALAQCKGISDMIADTQRLPPGGAAGLQAAGMTAADASLMVSSFGDLAALYRIAHAQQQQVGNNDFFFNARLLFGTQPMPL
jgi:hypothetical protein